MPYLRRFLALFLLALAAAAPVLAQTAAADWEAEVRKVDETFWNAYNAQDPDTMNALYTEDVEFYHDLGGSLLGLPALAKVNNGMKGSSFKLRRAAVPDSMQVFPMRRGPEIYGAIVMGQHDFYNVAPDKSEKLTGRASVTHLMLKKDGAWKIARILSYNHIRATDLPK